MKKFRTFSALLIHPNAWISAVQVVTDSSWNNLVIASENPVLVEFWAPWCGPCRMIAPVIDELAKEYAGKIICCKLNTDDCPNIATQYGIRSIPTVLFFKNGEKKESVIGAVPKSTLSTTIEKYITEGWKLKREMKIIAFGIMALTLCSWSFHSFKEVFRIISICKCNHCTLLHFVYFILSDLNALKNAFNSWVFYMGNSSRIRHALKSASNVRLDIERGAFMILHPDLFKNASDSSLPKSSPFQAWNLNPSLGLSGNIAIKLFFIVNWFFNPLMKIW
jgi:thioredoxin